MPLQSVVRNAFGSRRASKVSLSRYFPNGTCYFYGYPTGEASGFLNKVPPATEELVSARPLVCAGKDVAVVAFANPLQTDNLDFLRRQDKELFAPGQLVVQLPAALDAGVEGRQRNLRVKQSLKRLVKPGSLVMAQPFLDTDMERLFQIPPALTVWLNDKRHLNHFVPSDLLPERYAIYPNGAAFAASSASLPAPCVVKVSSSSAGDGVYICKDRRSLRAAQKVLAECPGDIVVEKYIQPVANYGVQFGVPENSQAPIDIIGISEQLTTHEGEFIGGLIDPNHNHNSLAGVKKRLLGEILPQVRELGWYGVGCFDVLVDAQGRAFIIDGNFRMTGMTAYLIMAANGQINSSLLSFSAEFHGSLAELEALLENLPLATDVRQPLRLISLAHHHGVYRFNAALLFHDRQRGKVMARQLLKAGIASKALEQLATAA